METCFSWSILGLLGGVAGDQFIIRYIFSRFRGDLDNKKSSQTHKLDESSARDRPTFYPIGDRGGSHRLVQLGAF